MPELNRRPLGMRNLFRVLLVGLCLLPACKPPPQQKPSTQENPLARQLAGARLDAAKAALEKNRHDQALLFLVSSLSADPTFPDALQATRSLLATTRWYFPSYTLQAGLPIERLSVSGNSLWTSLSSENGANTTVRWDLQIPAIEAVLFPRRAEQTKALILSPDHQRAIIQRGKIGNFTTLLCDASTLRPITELPAFPEIGSLTAFSGDGLLFSHNEMAGGKITWQIRDASSGEIIRSCPDPNPSTIAAGLDRKNLTVYHADGSSLQIPVSPTAEPTSSSSGERPAVPEDFTLSGDLILLADAPPIHATAKITAAALDGETFYLGTASGSIEIHRLLPAPGTLGRGLGPFLLKESELNTFAHLSEALAGFHFDETSRSFTPLSEIQRRKALEACDIAQLANLIDGLDFSKVRNAAIATPLRETSPHATFLLEDRLARASGGRVPPARSPDPATTLALALEGDQAAPIAACLESASHLPPFLTQLALARLAWLDDRKPDAIRLWWNGFPDYEKIRRTQDWDGWETADFAPAYTTLSTQIKDLLASYELTEESTADQRRVLAARLLDPATSRVIGKEKHAAACLIAAESSADFPDEVDQVFQLTILARALGAPPVKCLRTDATALMTGGDFAKAHEAWISIISDYPIETHLSRDYAEAAYTAFENGNGEQAMSILGTGVSHFPRDADFAYRAGWISLLTGRYPEAYEFLQVGQHLGFPPERQEKATALLAIAAAATGDSANAADFHKQLTALNSEWSAPEPPKAADWPEELKSILRAFVEPPKAIPVFEE